MPRSFVKFRASPYAWTVYFFTDRDKWARYVARRGAGTIAEMRARALDCDGICTSDKGNTSCYVGVFTGEIHTLAHEMTHAAAEILGDAGVRWSTTNQEALAYLIEYLVEQTAPALVATWK